MLEGLKAIFASKKALLVTVLLGIYSGFVFAHLITVQQFTDQTLPIILTYLGVEGATGITAIIKGALRAPVNESGAAAADVPAAVPAAEPIPAPAAAPAAPAAEAKE